MLPLLPLQPKPQRCWSNTEHRWVLTNINLDDAKQRDADAADALRDAAEAAANHDPKLVYLDAAQAFSHRQILAELTSPRADDADVLAILLAKIASTIEDARASNHGPRASVLDTQDALSRAVPLVVAALVAHAPNHSGLAREGCRALARLAHEHASNVKAAVSAGAIAPLVQISETAAADVDGMYRGRRWAMAALNALAWAGGGSRAAVGASGAASAAVAAFRDCKAATGTHLVELHTACCSLLARLCEAASLDQAAGSVIHAGGLVVATEALMRPAGRELQLAALSVLSNLAVLARTRKPQARTGNGGADAPRTADVNVVPRWKQLGPRQADALAEAAEEVARESDLAARVRDALRDEAVASAMVATVETAKSTLVLCRCCATAELLLTGSGGAYGDSDGRQRLRRAGLLHALCRVHAVVAHDEASNSYSELPERYSDKALPKRSVGFCVAELIGKLSQQ